MSQLPNSNIRWLRAILPALAVCVLRASATQAEDQVRVPPPSPVNPAIAVQPLADISPEFERRVSRRQIGAPYQVEGVWYVPSEAPTYDVVGTASWYGGGFDGQTTANGERYDSGSLTAAHATLPLASMVEVTNLQNGRILRVRLNDRGPFKPGRIIDLSKAAAERLGFTSDGTAQVRVRYVGPAGGPTPPSATEAIQVAAPATPRPVRAAPVAAPAAYVIQVGVFSVLANAERIAQTLGATEKAVIRPRQVDGRDLYAVTTGAWSARDAAGKALDSMIAHGFTDARVVRGE